MLNKEEEKLQLELFKKDMLNAWDNRHELGRLYYDIYNMKFFLCGNQKKSTMKGRVVRYIKTKERTIELYLTPVIVSSDKEVSYRYLTDIDEDIFNYIIYKASHNIVDIPKVFISLNEIRDIFKYDKRRIKESLYILAKYKVEFGEKQYEGVFPSQFLDDVIIERGRYARTCVHLSPLLYEYVKKNKYVIMNYDKLFKLKLRISKILYKRINITNIFNYNEKDNVLKLKESVMSLLSPYGIQYSTPNQKKRLFEDLDKALEELKVNNIIQHYKKEPIFSNKSIIDYKLTLYITDDFACGYAINQKLKPVLEKEQVEKLLIPKV